MIQYRKILEMAHECLSLRTVSASTGHIVSAAISLYALSSALKTQNPDIWPTVNTRNIIATSPIGYEVIIGQETIVKYYGNSSRTKLIKTIQKIYWVG